VNFYSSVVQWGDKLLVRGINNGKPYKKRVAFQPTLYLKTDKPSDFKTMTGEDVKPVVFEGIKAAKEFVDRYEGMESVPIYGNTGFVYQFLHERWPQAVEFDQNQLHICTIDIETSSEEGFPEITNPVEQVLLITVQNLATKTRLTWGLGKFDLDKATHLKSKEHITYIECRNERELLEKFIRWWASDYPDVITGWNIHLFDIPYLVARIYKVLGEQQAQMLSPWGTVREKMIAVFSDAKDTLTFDIQGVTQLDYLDLFKKFANRKPENYKLDTVAFDVLKRNKLEKPYETFREFYQNDWQLFTEYNMIDVELVDEMDDELQLISLALTIAYDAKCNLSDVFSPVKLWDCLIYNHLALKNIQVPQRASRERRKIVGGFVREIKPQKFEWVVSFDATSLYPSIILQYNLSPEKLVEGFALDTTVDGLLEGRYDLSVLKDKDVAMTANGYTFKRDSQGFFAEIVERLFNERVMYKKQMLVHEKNYEASKDHGEKKLASKFDNYQQARKIQLNSLFGAMANNYFRFFDTRIAEGITMTGQYIIQRVSEDINSYLNKVCKTGGYNYSFYSDTDSCYVSMGPLVDKLYKGLEPQKITTILDKICKDQIGKVLLESANTINTYTNGFAQKIYFKREAIADHAIFLGSKHYAMTVWDNEGIRYDKPKLKVKGFQMVKSDTPAVIKDALKDALMICLRETEDKLHVFMSEYEKKFVNFTPEQIAFPKGVNGLGKYRDESAVFMKGTPMHVRASLMYNYLMKQKKLDHKYPLINEGEKIKFIYLKEPNHVGQNVIAFLGSLPKELGLSTYIDYKTMFEKLMINPVEKLTNALGWSVEPQATLEGLFE
jgi:DNA polymerase elongation subunit (family B)